VRSRPRRTRGDAGARLPPAYRSSRHTSLYWLHVEVKAAANLDHLDGFLRDIWVECCEHLSAFRIGKSEYTTVPSDDSWTPRGSPNLSVKLSEALDPLPPSFTYEYDFGSTTLLRLKVVRSRQGAIGKAPLRLLARNEPLVWPCHACKEPASRICPRCSFQSKAFVGKKHSQTHGCRIDEEEFLPVVNSPRMGVCGYTV